MGLLTGKNYAASRLPADDVRAAQPWVGYLDSGRPAPAWLTRLRACCTVHSPVGLAVTPPTCIRRLVRYCSCCNSLSSAL
jgi:hypothetical protein